MYPDNIPRYKTRRSDRSRHRTRCNQTTTSPVFANIIAFRPRLYPNRSESSRAHLRYPLIYYITHTHVLSLTYLLNQLNVEGLCSPRSKYSDYADQLVACDPGNIICGSCRREMEAIFNLFMMYLLTVTFFQLRNVENRKNSEVARSRLC